METNLQQSLVASVWENIPPRRGNQLNGNWNTSLIEQVKHWVLPLGGKLIEWLRNP